MTPEFTPIDQELEQAVTEIRNDAPDDAVVEAAAARVWSRLAVAAAEQTAPHIRNCADFQALLPEYRAGRLSEARATLVKDHLHNCVACRNVYQGKVVAMPAGRPAVRKSYTLRWLVPAGAIAAGVLIWVVASQYGGAHGRAYVQALNGTMYEVTAAGIRPLAQGQDLPDNIEVRTAKDSDAMLQLRDGSMVELRERSGVSTASAGRDLTVHLVRGSVIVQAAHRSSGHLFVATPDCRVAVTGTVFSVSAGVKGSRVSVVQGEVHVEQDNRDNVLHPGQQYVSSKAIEPVSVKDDIDWSRNREKLIQQLQDLRAGLSQIHFPALRYSSRLLDRMPDSTGFYAAIPNLAPYLAQAENVFQQKLAESPELSGWWKANENEIWPVVEHIRQGSEYLGDEIAIVGLPDKGSVTFVAEVKRPGFEEFLKKISPRIEYQMRPDGLVVFGERSHIDAITAALDGRTNFANSPFHARIAQAYQNGAGFLFCADLTRLMSGHEPLKNANYFIAEQKEVNNQMQTRASLSFDGPRTGIASWLGAPSPMGSLEYVSPEATVVTAFVVKNPVAIVDEIVAMEHPSPEEAAASLAETQQMVGFDVRNDLAASLGGEFSLSLDGPVAPVPSWKLVIEVYNPDRFQYVLQKIVQAHNAKAEPNAQPLRTGQETVNGRTYYMLGWGPVNPLTEIHYTFSSGYLVGAPSRALVDKALHNKQTGTSITRSTQFLALVPADHYAHFSALMYQNLGTSLSGIAGIIGALVPQGATGPNGQNPGDFLNKLGNMKPSMIAAYGEPDRITMAGSTDMGGSLTGFLRGGLPGVLGSVVPLPQMMGTPAHHRAF